jgi:hypothetical protein
MIFNLRQKVLVYFGFFCLVFLLPLVIWDMTSGFKPSNSDFLDAVNDKSFGFFELSRPEYVLERRETKSNHYEAVVLSTHKLSTSFYERIVFDDAPETSTYKLKFKKGTEISVLEYFETQPNRNGNGLERGGYSMRRVKAEIAEKDLDFYRKVSDFYHASSPSRVTREKIFAYGSGWLEDNYPNANLIE